MSDEWEVGDLALCLLTGPWFNWAYGDGTDTMRGPQAGEVNRVCGSFIDEYGDLQLELAEYPGDDFLASVFRKIRPDEHEDCEPEFVELLNRIKRKVAA